MGLINIRFFLEIKAIFKSNFKKTKIKCNALTSSRIAVRKGLARSWAETFVNTSSHAYKLIHLKFICAT